MKLFCTGPVVNAGSQLRQERNLCSHPRHPIPQPRRGGISFASPPAIALSIFSHRKAANSSKREVFGRRNSKNRRRNPSAGRRSPVLGVAGRPRPVATRPQVVATRPQVVAGRPIGIATRTRGVAGRPKGVATRKLAIAGRNQPSQPRRSVRSEIFAATHAFNSTTLTRPAAPLSRSHGRGTHPRRAA